MSKYTRLNPKVRKAEILEAALRLSKEHGYTNVTREQLAKAAGTSPPLITRYFQSMEVLRVAIMEQAVSLPVPAIVAQGLVSGCPIAKAAPSAVRADALASIT